MSHDSQPHNNTKPPVTSNLMRRHDDLENAAIDTPSDQRDSPPHVARPNTEGCSRPAVIPDLPKEGSS